MTSKLRLALRLFLGLVFFTAGMAKLTHNHFPGIIGPVWLEDVLAEHNLGLYARFIALSQVGIGWLLLSGRFATLGAVMLVPMLTNILVVTISLEWRGTPYVNAVLLSMNLLLLWLDRERLLTLVARAGTLPPHPAPLPGAPWWTPADWLVVASLGAVVIGGYTALTWWPAGWVGVVVGAGLAVGGRGPRSIG